MALTPISRLLISAVNYHDEVFSDAPNPTDYAPRLASATQFIDPVGQSSRSRSLAVVSSDIERWTLDLINLNVRFGDLFDPTKLDTLGFPNTTSAFMQPGAAYAVSRFHANHNVLSTSLGVTPLQTIHEPPDIEVFVDVWNSPFYATDGTAIVLSNVPAVGGIINPTQGNIPQGSVYKLLGHAISINKGVGNINAPRALTIANKVISPLRPEGFFAPTDRIMLGSNAGTAPAGTVTDEYYPVRFYYSKRAYPNAASCTAMDNMPLVAKDIIDMDKVMANAVSISQVNLTAWLMRELRNQLPGTDFTTAGLADLRQAPFTKEVVENLAAGLYIPPASLPPARLMNRNMLQLNILGIYLNSICLTR